ncbi:MAG TPA: universal stress protein [Bacteroidales bacterium]|nr:universal stress protein [Bacteroidales bacterium]
MDTQNKPTILFPYDFSPESDFAIEYLVGLSKTFNFSVEILNIYDVGTKKFMQENNLDKSALEDRIRQMSVDLQEKHGIMSTYLIKNTAVKNIRKISLKEHVTFTLLGISKPYKPSNRIIKVITTSPVPVFVVQKGVPYKPFKNIVFPLDDSPASRQKAAWALKFASTFEDVLIHIYTISPAALKSKEREFKQYKVIESCEHFFARNGVKFVTETSQGSYKDYPMEIKKYAESINADMFIIMIRPKKMFSNVDPVDIQLIFNQQKLPLLCVNQRDLNVGGGFN